MTDLACQAEGRETTARPDLENVCAGGGRATQEPFIHFSPTQTKSDLLGAEPGRL